MFRFAKRGFKESQVDAKYWKKFENTILERDKSGILTLDINFCEGAKHANLCAMAISARVDLYKMVKKDLDDYFVKEYGEDYYSLKPSSSVHKFDEIVTSV